jgi:uncharacterized membrane protein
MTAHVAACIAWVLLHLLVAGTWRPTLAARLGEHGFRGLFSALSALFLGVMIWTYIRAPYVELWASSQTLNVIPVLVMPLAFFLLVAALRPSNPTLAGADMLLGDLLPDIGITRVTRHPLLWGFALWAVSHMAANGDLATQLLCAAVLLTALNGMFSIDRKKRRQLGAAYAEFERKTSIIPFAAILQGRNTFKGREIGWMTLVLALLLYAGAYWLHGRFGVPVSF